MRIAQPRARRKITTPIAAFAPVKDMLQNFTPRAHIDLSHPFFTRSEACTMLIDEVEAIWKPIAETDDWSVFHAKLETIDQMEEAYALLSVLEWKEEIWRFSKKEGERIKSKGKIKSLIREKGGGKRKKKKREIRMAGIASSRHFALFRVRQADLLCAAATFPSRKPVNRPRMMRSASSMMRSINSFTVGMSWINPTTMPQLQAPASMSPSIITFG